MDRLLDGYGVGVCAMVKTPSPLTTSTTASLLDIECFRVSCRLSHRLSCRPLSTTFLSRCRKKRKEKYLVCTCGSSFLSSLFLFFTFILEHKRDNIAAKKEAL